jgi:hypothetical protein
MTPQFNSKSLVDDDGSRWLAIAGFHYQKGATFHFTALAHFICFTLYRGKSVRVKRHSIALIIHNYNNKNSVYLYFYATLLSDLQLE